MKTKNLIPVLSLALAIGCASPQSVTYDNVKREPTTEVRIFREGTKPERAVREIGEVSYEDFGGEDARATKELMMKAQKIGANGIIMLPRKDTGYTFNAFGRSGNKYIWKAVAFVYE